MRPVKPILALALLAGLGGAALAQSSPGQTQATPPQPGRPQADASPPASPQPAATDLRDYARILQEAEDQLRQAIQRSGSEPASNQQKAMTPARMDMKAAAQRVHGAVRRVPRELRGDALYEDAERAVREGITPLSMPLSLEDTDGAAQRVLGTVEKLRAEVARRAGA
ncbi:hypothetical protein [Teichococcus aestuarii]|uniref:hypothetical protein n=2 Tax=Teichococcus aestuarii TaxID=568898 RepID=UPI0011B27A92|nr:hypothetical protein [Pseudoroseomonas aestuarii]